MAQQIIDTVGNTDTIKSGGDKINANFTELYSKIGAQYGYAELDANGEVVQFQASLRQAIGNIMSPLVHIPFKRQDDEVALSGLQTFTRASTATYVDPLDGLVKTAAIDTPRFERMSDGETGILLEGASTNLMLDSEAFNSGQWTVSATTITGNATVAPDSTTTADLIVGDTTNAYHRVFQYATVPANTDITISRYVKAAGYNWFALNAAGVSNGWIWFDLLNGTVGSIGSAVKNYGITPLTNGWYRVWLAVNTGALAGVGNDGWFCPADFVNTYIGDGTSGGYVWGAQLEALPFASSYIPTTTAAVTRAADSLSIGAYGNKPMRTNSMTYVCDADLIGNDPTTNQYVFNVVGGNQDSIHIETTLAVSSYWGGNWNHGNPNDISPTQTNRLALISDGSVFHTAINGTANNSSMSIGGGSVTESTIIIGASGATNGKLYGHIRNFRIYDRALTPEEIAMA